jgi:hypothetical protein
MSTFETTKTVPVTLPDLTPVAEEVMQHFRAQEYEVAGQPTLTHGWHISIKKGTTFKKVMGMQTALNIDIEPAGGATMVKAGVGIFDQQLIPTLITVFVAWPLIIAQIWGMVQQSNLDDEAIGVIERSLMARGGGAVPAPPVSVSFGSSASPSYGTPAGTDAPRSPGAFGGPITPAPASGPNMAPTSGGYSSGYSSGPAGSAPASSPPISSPLASTPISSVPLGTAGSAGSAESTPGGSAGFGGSGGVGSTTPGTPATDAAAGAVPKYCASCGTELAANAKFCPECGMKAA